MIIIFSLFLFFSLLGVITLAHYGKYNYSADVIVVCCVFLPSLFISGWLVGKTSMILKPFFVFGVQRTLQEDIKVVKVQQRRAYFSNGESVYQPGNLLINFYSIVSFLVIMTLVMISLRLLAYFLTNKISPQLYGYLLNNWPLGHK